MMAADLARRRPARIAWSALSVLLAMPLPAAAHLVNTGLGPVYDGIGHFLFSLEELLPLVALALLAGLNGSAAARSAVFLLPIAWLTGGALALLAGSHLAGTPLAWAPAILILVLGAAVAVDRRLPLVVLRGLLLGAGLAVGLLSGRGLAPLADGGFLLLGGFLAQLVLLTWLCAMTVAAVRRADWLRIALRVAGSWIAASGLLLLGWQLRG